MKNKFYLLYVFALLQGIAFAQAPNISYATTTQNCTVGAAITPLTPVNTGGGFTYGKVTTFSSNFSSPAGVAVDTQGNVYVADSYSSAITKMTPAGLLS